MKLHVASWATIAVALACASSVDAQYRSRSGTLICAPNGVCRPAPLAPSPEADAKSKSRVPAPLASPQTNAGGPAHIPDAPSTSPAPDAAQEPEAQGLDGCTKFSPAVQKAGAAAIADLRARINVKTVNPREVNEAFVHGTVSRVGRVQYNAPEIPSGFISGGYKDPWPGATNLALSLLSLDKDHMTLRACFPDFVNLVKEVTGHIEARDAASRLAQEQQEAERKKQIEEKRWWQQQALQTLPQTSLAAAALVFQYRNKWDGGIVSYEPINDRTAKLNVTPLGETWLKGAELYVAKINACRFQLRVATNGLVDQVNFDNLTTEYEIRPGVSGTRFIELTFRGAGPLFCQKQMTQDEFFGNDQPKDITGSESKCRASLEVTVHGQEALARLRRAIEFIGGSCPFKTAPF
jgi:hypothetical protein